MKFLPTFVQLFICLFVYLLITPKALAVGEFQADYDVQYDIAPTGTTIVTQNVTLTNKLSNLYPQKYSIVIDSVKINNVIAFDNLGIVTPVISQKDGKTEISLPFNDKVVGLGKQLKFSLRYENHDIAAKNGNIWEVNIPGIAKDPDLASYNVALRVPQTFGPNAYMTPPPAVAGRWTKEQMTRGGISAAYGNTQIFSLNLAYYIENPTITPRLTELALPPNTGYQEVKVESLTPKPKTVLKDGDGNWLAQYELLPTQRLAVTAKVTVVVHLAPRPNASETLPNRADYLKPQKYWESQSSDIVAVAKTLKTPRDIYNYVVSTLSYDYQRVNQIPVRQGARKALSAPKTAICMEFTDLFIALARAAGIPAREAVGYAYTTNAKLRPLSLVSDVLHAWPEYYDSERKLWVPVDPTWANTTGGVNYFDKLDFNHIVFAIHGLQSDYPYPVGFYKKTGSTSKDVGVSFSELSGPFESGKLATQYNFPSSVTSGFPANGTVIIENTSGVAISQADVTIQSVPNDVAIQKRLTDIPPLARISIPVSVQLPSYFAQGKGVLTTQVNDQSSTYYFDIHPLVYRYIFPLLGFSVILLLLAWLSVKKPWIKLPPKK